MSRTPTRRIAKWTGLVVCGVVVILMLVGQWRWWSLSHGGYTAAFRQGHVAIEWVTQTYGQDWAVAHPDTGPSPWFQFSPESRGYVGLLHIPIWAPPLALAIPTAWLWRRDRCHPPGHCRKCGYDLTGNVTGVCSECGTKVGYS